MHDITTNSEFTEEQVIEKLLELRRSHSESAVYVTYGEALEIVCDALERGHFYSLYEILDTNAEITLVDAGRSVCGVRAVIDLVANERARCLSEYAITCDVLRVKESERYGVGERCILLTRRRENGGSQSLVIKVRFEDYKIYNLEVLEPRGALRLVTDED